MQYVILEIIKRCFFSTLTTTYIIHTIVHLWQTEDSTEDPEDAGERSDPDLGATPAKGVKDGHAAVKADDDYDVGR